MGKRKKKRAAKKARDKAQVELLPEMAEATAGEAEESAAEAGVSATEAEPPVAGAEDHGADEKAPPARNGRVHGPGRSDGRVRDRSRRSLCPEARACRRSGRRVRREGCGRPRRDGIRGLDAGGGGVEVR